MNKKCILTKKTIQEDLIHSIEKTEKLNREAIQDLDERIFQMLFAYCGSLDYGSIQMLEGVFKRALERTLHIKKQTAEMYIQKDLENNPHLKFQFDMIKSEINKSHNRFSSN